MATSAVSRALCSDREYTALRIGAASPKAARAGIYAYDSTSEHSM